MFSARVPAGGANHTAPLLQARHCVCTRSSQESARRWNHVGIHAHLILLTVWPLCWSPRWAGSDPAVGEESELCRGDHNFLMVQIEVSLLPLLVRRSDRAGLGLNRHRQTTPPKPTESFLVRAHALWSYHVLLIQCLQGGCCPGREDQLGETGSGNTQQKCFRGSSTEGLYLSNASLRMQGSHTDLTSC